MKRDNFNNNNNEIEIVTLVYFIQLKFKAK